MNTALALWHLPFHNKSVRKMRVNDWMKEWRPLTRSFSAQASRADKPEILGVSLFISWNRCTSEHLFIVPLISRDKWPDGEIPEKKKKTKFVHLCPNMAARWHGASREKMR